jgi:hypothetical protein
MLPIARFDALLTAVMEQIVNEPDGRARASGF